jgi:hypothetical protein
MLDSAAVSVFVAFGGSARARATGVCSRPSQRRKVGMLAPSGMGSRPRSARRAFSSILPRRVRARSSWLVCSERLKRFPAKRKRRRMFPQGSCCSAPVRVSCDKSVSDYSGRPESQRCKCPAIALSSLSCHRVVTELSPSCAWGMKKDSRADARDGLSLLHESGGGGRTAGPLGQAPKTRRLNLTRDSLSSRSRRRSLLRGPRLFIARHSSREPLALSRHPRESACLAPPDPWAMIEPNRIGTVPFSSNKNPDCPPPISFAGP